MINHEISWRNVFLVILKFCYSIRNAGAGEVQNKSDTHKEEELIFSTLEEQSNNESQKVNHTSKSQ